MNREKAASGSCVQYRIADVGSCGTVFQALYRGSEFGHQERDEHKGYVGRFRLH